MNFGDNVGDPLHFPTSLPGCLRLCHVSFKGYLPVSLEVVEKPNKCKVFWPLVFGRDDPNFAMADC